MQAPHFTLRLLQHENSTTQYWFRPPMLHPRNMYGELVENLLLDMGNKSFYPATFPEVRVLWADA